MDEIVYRVETWVNSSKTGETVYNDPDQAIAWWTHLTEMVSLDTEVRLISPAC